MKLIFPVVFIVIIIAALVIKNKYSNALMNNAESTTGTIIAVFQKGKLPYCTYEYTVDGKLYKRNNFLPKHLVKKAKGLSYSVKYQKDKPQNAQIVFK